MMKSDASQLDDLLRRGIDLHRSNRFLEAEACYKEVLAQDPNNADAIHLLGLLADAIGNKDLAVDLIKYAVSVQPDNAIFYNNLANIFKSKSEFDLAIGCYRQALSIDSSYIEASCNLANLYREQGSLDEAILLYRHALSISPDLGIAMINLAETLSELGQFGEAIGWYKRCLKLNPDDIFCRARLADVHFALGRQHEDKGLYEEALVNFEEALAASPIHSASKKKLEYLKNILPEIGIMSEKDNGRNRKVEILDKAVIRNFKCSDNPLDIFDGYVELDGKILHSCRRWFGQGDNHVGEFLSSRVVFRGKELDYGDDPRIFLHQGQVNILSNTFSELHGFRNHLSVINERGDFDRYYLMLPLGLSQGKNWSPFEFPDGRLGFVFSFSPLIVLMEIKREKGVILLKAIEGQGIPEAQGDGNFPAHRGGTNGIRVGDSVFGVGHTTKLSSDQAGARLIHRPYCWFLDIANMSMEYSDIEYPWDDRYYVVDPTSLIWDHDKEVGWFFTTEVERNFVDPTSHARTVKYQFAIR